MSKLSVFILLTVLVNLSWAADGTTESPVQDSTNKADNEPTTESAINVETSCSTSGALVAHESNCRMYRECVSGVLVTKSCPEGQAFCKELNKCGRNISACKLDVQCYSKGVIEDPNNDTSYYICQPSFTGSGFYIYHVHCDANEVYNPSLGTCVSELNGRFAFSQPVNEIPEIVAVKNEMKALKQIFKESLKRQKEQKKAEKSLVKKTEKEVKQQHKQEADNFVCETVGNFPSKVADNLYIACVNNKNTVIATPGQCNLNAKFNAQTGACVKSNSAA